MDIFGDLERFLSQDLYPYRWPITIGVVVAVFLAALIALRLRWHQAVWRHRVLAAAVLLPAVAVMIPVGWYLVSPLWERSYLEEASPLAAAAMPTVATASVSPQSESSLAPSGASLPRATHRGDFMGADDFHFGRGTAQIIETAPGSYTLRLEEFSVRNGPDLVVYLTPDATGESIDGAISLGDLKATDGAFNYEIPAGTDISMFASAIVWCRQFSTLFASAELMPI